jgi:exonuclease III
VPKSPYWLIAALLLSLACLNETHALAQGERDEVIMLAWWNLENLFDTTNDVDRLPQFGSDDDFTPQGAREWTLNRYEQKLRNVASVMRLMNNGEGPDIIGVCEVEHEHILRELSQTHLPEKNYEIVYHESPDARGIDVSFLYKADVLELLSWDYRSIPHSDDGEPTRDIVFAEFECEWNRIVCIGNHWPSRRGGAEESEPRRVLAAKICRAVVDSILYSSPSKNIVVMGDFNDYPTDISMTNFLGASLDSQAVREDPTSLLYNCMAEWNADTTRGTYLYRGRWNVLDHFAISSSLLGAGVMRFQGVDIYDRDFLKEKSGPYAGAPWPTYGGRKYLGGYSDHFPILLRIGVMYNDGERE